MENPNPYDDGLFTKRSIELNDAIGAYWEAGASLEDLEGDIANALENATEHRFDVILNPA